MFDFVEQPVCIRDYEHTRYQKRVSTPVMVQAGVQPVAMVTEDVSMVGRPQSLLGSVFGFRRRKG